ncbi:MAG: P-loop NTPase [Clostridia bacterium]|nr:P-loop NTPase [Clostridia bacterium]
MEHTEIRVVTSAKGGVGKSTVCTGLGAALAARGKRVLLIDCDTANRSLDLMLGLEDEVLFGMTDVLCGRCEASRAVLAVPGYEDNLFLLPAGGGDTAVCGRDALKAIVDAFTDGNDTSPHFDYIFIDTPGGVREVLLSAAAVSGEALIVSSAQATAVRSAQNTADLILLDTGLGNARLVINQFMGGECFFSHTRVRGRRRKQTAATDTLFSVVDTVALPLLGVVPFDAAVWEVPNAGQLPPSSPVTRAFSNMAARLCHRNVPLFS